VTDITWILGRVATAVGTGMNDWSGSTQSVAGAPRTGHHRAFNLETCAGKPMYSAVEWYSLSKRSALQPENYEDVCTGPVRRPDCLSYVQATALLQSDSRPG